MTGGQHLFEQPRPENAEEGVLSGLLRPDQVERAFRRLGVRKGIDDAPRGEFVGQHLADPDPDSEPSRNSLVEQLAAFETVDAGQVQVVMAVGRSPVLPVVWPGVGLQKVSLPFPMVLRCRAGRQEAGGADGNQAAGEDLLAGASPVFRPVGQNGGMDSRAFKVDFMGMCRNKTVYDNMAFGLHVRGEDKQEIDRRVRAAAASLDLEALLDRKPRQLSGGQMQRVALGRALVRDPDVFLLDEPLSNLDAKLRVKMREEIATLHARLRATMIFVTHDQVEAMTLGDRIVIMRDGVIQQAGKPLELYDTPANTFVAGFIGSPEMNLIDGQLIDEGGRMAVRSGDLTISIPERTFTTNEGTVTLGIRPEHLVIADGSPFEMTVSLVEQIGAQTYLMGMIAGHREVVRDFRPICRSAKLWHGFHVRRRLSGSGWRYHRPHLASATHEMSVDVFHCNS